MPDLFDHDASCAVCFDPVHPGKVCQAPDMPYVDEFGDEHPTTCGCDHSISMTDRGKKEVRLGAG